MTQKPTVDMMKAAYPAATTQLLEVIESNLEVIRSGNNLVFDTKTGNYELLVVPILDALGFDEANRSVEFDPFDHVMLSVAGNEIALLMNVQLGVSPCVTTLLGRMLAEDEEFQLRIVVTNGLRWCLYSPAPDREEVVFDLPEAETFWDLLTIGQANHRRNLGQEPTSNR